MEGSLRAGALAPSVMRTKRYGPIQPTVGVPPEASTRCAFAFAWLRASFAESKVVKLRAGGAMT